MQFNMDHSLGFVLNRTALASKNRFNQMIKAYGISPEQWSVLYRVVEQGGISQKVLADSTYKDQGNLTRMIDKLIEKGYIRREADADDRRAVKLFATEKSVALAEAVAPLSGSHNESMTIGFSHEEKATLIALLDKVYQNLQKDEHEK
ncbi:MarR family winged helix-turn-helix transcriptional regulator [Sulfurovum sp.]|jgi:DNA-binding MarR family transcriptional regulator|uniref:MarR family winged helix-turn-helix transcriptional regulator n=1 Tax=Sulfurovum sp. TaxID=1969726 RepID=UPI002A36EAB6|nr:MarR family winged helix-turn-helix transcriptional regulator [Sulfurovum sp.]MDY0403910.1 MarR family winged helix-turn-helix transcriptional regulator [Sulfurovum sp.]